MPPPKPQPRLAMPNLPQRWPCPRTVACPSFCSPTPTSALRQQDQAEPCPRGPSKPLSQPQACPRTTWTGLANPSPYSVFIQLVITALKCHKYDKNIQVTGSAALFYLTNSEYRSEQSIRLRRQVIQVVLNGMESYQEVTVSPHPLPALTQTPHFLLTLCVPASPAGSQSPPGAMLALNLSLLALYRPPQSPFPAALLPDSGTWHSGPWDLAPPGQSVAHCHPPPGALSS